MSVAATPRLPGKNALSAYAMHGVARGMACPATHKDRGSDDNGVKGVLNVRINTAWSGLV